MKNIIIRWVALIALLFIAISFYGLGGKTGIFAFILVGFCFEGLFWYLGFMKKKKPTTTS